jgi:hypothetical protein
MANTTPVEIYPKYGIYKILCSPVMQWLGKQTYLFVTKLAANQLIRKKHIRSVCQTHSFNEETVFWLSDVDFAIFYDDDISFPQYKKMVRKCKRELALFRVFDTEDIIFVPYSWRDRNLSEIISYGDLFPRYQWKLLAGENVFNNEHEDSNDSSTKDKAMGRIREIPSMLIEYPTMDFEAYYFYHKLMFKGFSQKPMLSIPHPTEMELVNLWFDVCNEMVEDGEKHGTFTKKKLSTPYVELRALLQTLTSICHDVILSEIPLSHINESIHTLKVTMVLKDKPSVEEWKKIFKIWKQIENLSDYENKVRCQLVTLSNLSDVLYGNCYDQDSINEFFNYSTTLRHEELPLVYAKAFFSAEIERFIVEVLPRWSYRKVTIMEIKNNVNRLVGLLDQHKAKELIAFYDESIKKFQVSEEKLYMGDVVFEEICSYLFKKLRQ